jgi:hypothetical protein
MAKQQKQPYRANHGQGFPPVNPYLTPQLRPPASKPSRRSRPWLNVVPKVLGATIRLCVVAVLLAVVLWLAALGYRAAGELWRSSGEATQVGILAMVLITVTALVKLVLKRAF